jgi:hypothetical protein
MSLEHASTGGVAPAWVEIGRSYRRKVRRALRRRGVAGTVRLVGRTLVARLLPALAARRRAPAAPSAFDVEHGVDTSGTIELHELAIPSPDVVHGVCYQPTPPEIFREMMAQLPIRHPEFTFVDIGSGKGLVLLLASDSPFQRIEGVEFAAELHAVAERNLRAYRGPSRRCHDLVSVHVNALEYELPATPLVLYLFNPFRQPIMAALLRRIEASLAAHPRPMWILYYNAAQHGVFDASPHFERAATDVDYVIYRSRS